MNNTQHAILARDIIQMIREYADDANVLEYLESFTSSFVHIFHDDIVSWSDIAGVCDQRYYSLKQGTPIDLNDTLLTECEHKIEPYLAAIE